MAGCDHYPRESWVLQLNKYREEVMHCHKCGKYKGHYKEVVKKPARQIVKDEPTEHYLPLIGDAGNGD